MNSSRKLYSYIIPTDDGAAPNPFGDTCTLTICKPAIRRNARCGNWVIGTGSKNVFLRDGVKRDFSKHLVYAMLVTDKKTLEEYDSFCQKKLPIKLPKWKSSNYARVVGDCLYEFRGTMIFQREGIHDTEDQFYRDISGQFSLLSNHFYYFGSLPIRIPKALQHIIHTTQNCKLIQDEKNFIYAEPQLKYAFENVRC